MKIALIGSGTIVPVFLEAAAKEPLAEIYAIFGREKSIEKLKTFQEKYDIPVIYHDYDKLLADEQIDAVYMALNNHLHYAFAKKAIEAGKHVIMEKPFTSTYVQAKELAELAEKNNVFVFEAISNIYTPNFLKTKELLSQIGDVKIVQMNFSQYSKRYDSFKQGTVLPVFDKAMHGGALVDINVYNIHFIMALFGKPQGIHYSANMERGIDTSGILVMEYPTFQCVAIGAKDCKAPLAINIQGDKGYIHSTELPNEYNNFVLGMNDGGTEYFDLNNSEPRLLHELRTFVKMVENSDYELAKERMAHTLNVMEVMDEARAQVGLVFE